MSTNMAQPTVTVSLADLENLIRRVVREEISRLPRAPGYSILDDWNQEGPDDPEGDEELLQEALVMSQQYRENKEGWKSWEDFKTELKQETKAAHALPD